MQDLDTSALDSFVAERRYWTAAPLPGGRRGWPVIRLNALPIEHVPNVCRRVVCDIDGTAAVRRAVTNACVNILAVRSRVGVLAFGSDSDIRAAFEPYGIADFDVHTLDPNRQRYDSTERGLLREALTLAIKRHAGLDAIRHRNTDLLAPSYPDDHFWSPLKEVVGTLAGTVPGNQGLVWREGVGTRLDWADNCLWLLFEPKTVFDGMTADNKFAAAAFARERTVKRYNKQLNRLINCWSRLLTQHGTEFRALGIGDGIDAVYRISPTTGFSKRVGA